MSIYCVPNFRLFLGIFTKFFRIQIMGKTKILNPLMLMILAKLSLETGLLIK